MSPSFSHPAWPPFFLILTTFLLLTHSAAAASTCSSQNFTNNRLYANCTDLPTLNAYLHWSYDSEELQLDVAFVVKGVKGAKWVAWAINPTGKRMLGAQALVGYRLGNGSVKVGTYNVSSYKEVKEGNIGFEVDGLVGEYIEGDESMRIYGKVKLRKEIGVVLNQVWQVGDGVGKDGALGVHMFGADNLNAKGTLDLVMGKSSGGGGGGEGSSRLKKKNIHGILNAVSWGILFPVGIIVVRYLRTFKSADPAWFYIHASCQLSAYVIGVAGWATGLKLGNNFYKNHRNIGIVLFIFATLQIFALFIRPKKDHKFRIYWNIYHHGLGYAILVLGIINVFKGLSMLKPESKYKTAYEVVLIILAVIAVILEAITWIVVLRRKSNKTTTPYNGNGN